MTIQPEQAVQASIGYHEALGMMMWLMKHADYHSQWPIWSVDKDIVPALIHGQSKIYFDSSQIPVGFATWAWLDDEAREQLINNKAPLTIKQWNSGEHLMFGDFVAPWGQAKFILNDLRTQVFPECKAFSLGRNQDGSIRKVYHWKGCRFTEKVTEDQRSINKQLWANPTLST